MGHVVYSSAFRRIGTISVEDVSVKFHATVISFFSYRDDYYDRFVQGVYTLGILSDGMLEHDVLRVGTFPFFRFVHMTGCRNPVRCPCGVYLDD